MHDMWLKEVITGPWRRENKRIGKGSAMSLVRTKWRRQDKTIQTLTRAIKLTWWDRNWKAVLGRGDQSGKLKMVHPKQRTNQGIRTQICQRISWKGAILWSGQPLEGEKTGKPKGHPHRRHPRRNWGPGWGERMQDEGPIVRQDETKQSRRGLPHLCATKNWDWRTRMSGIESCKISHWKNEGCEREVINVPYPMPTASLPNLGRGGERTQKQ